jgi:hypothetical protein
MRISYFPAGTNLDNIFQCNYCGEGFWWDDFQELRLGYGKDKKRVLSCEQCCEDMKGLFISCLGRNLYKISTD